jgi:hypothetical protein
MPLILLEFVMNSHNDGWMLAPAVWGLWFIYRYYQSGLIKFLFIGLVLWSISIFIKFATLAMLPLIFLLIIMRFCTQLKCFISNKISLTFSTQLVALIASALMMLPLLTAQSQWFHPWYLIWSLIWLPLITHQYWRIWLISLAISSSFRYLPWLYSGSYDSGLMPAVSITWIGAGMIFACVLIWRKFSLIK